jgi:hypothetical protein
MKTKIWSNILTVAGGIAMAVGGLDPLEGSVLILPGSGLLALGTYLGKAERRAVASKVWAFVLTSIGIGATWGLSMMGGFGGSTGRSGWLGLLLLPYLVGWCMAIWGPGSPRWLSFLGIGVGLWYLNLAFGVLGGGSSIAIICAAIGVLTIGGCLYRLIGQMKAKTITVSV